MGVFLRELLGMRWSATGQNHNQNLRPKPIKKNQFFSCPKLQSQKSLRK